MGNNTIINQVTYIIENILDKQGLEKARKELIKLYLKYYNTLESIEDKRQIMNYIMYVELELGMINMVKIHSEELKRDMDKEEYYIEDFPEYYIQMLKYYNVSHNITVNEQMINNKNTNEYKFKVIC